MPYKDKRKQAAYQLKYILDRRREWIEKHGPCAICLSDERLEVDHMDPSEKESHRIWSWSEERRNTELAKCRVLCRRCHQIRHSTAMSFPHGTQKRYRRYKCRCEACRSAHAEYIAKYRRRKGKWPLSDSNGRPIDYEPTALTAELRGHTVQAPVQARLFSDQKIEKTCPQPEDYESISPTI